MTPQLKTPTTLNTRKSGRQHDAKMAPKYLMAAIIAGGHFGEW